jgi:hypothetical protein
MNSTTANNVTVFIIYMNTFRSTNSLSTAIVMCSLALSCSIRKTNPPKEYIGEWKEKRKIIVSCMKKQ